MFGFDLSASDTKAILKARDEAKAKNPQRLLHRVGHTICLTHPETVLWSKSDGLVKPMAPKIRQRRTRRSNG